jgi:hypothetical protein
VVTCVWLTGVRHNARDQTREEATVQDDTTTRLEAVSVDETKLKSHVDEVVRGSVEETLNTRLDSVADRICRAQRYERSPGRADTRAGLCPSHPGTPGSRFLAPGRPTTGVTSTRPGRPG